MDFDVDIEGNYYVVDRERDMLVKFSSRGDSLEAISGTGTGPLQFDGPTAVFAHRGTDVLVADYNNHRIQRFDRNLDYVTTIHLRDDPDERRRFGYPRDVAITRQGDLLIVDGENRRVLMLTSFGELKRSIGDIGAGVGRLSDPHMVCSDDRDNVYVLDGGVVMIYDAFGSYLARITAREVPTLQGEIVTMAINGDMLVLGSATAVHAMPLGADGGAATVQLPEAVAAARWIDGRLAVAERHRMVLYEMANR